MKTNHQRNFIADIDLKACDIRSRDYNKVSTLSDRSIGATATAGDSTCGKHGISQKRRGAKKYVRSRIRFHENSTVKKELTNRESSSEKDTEFSMTW